MFKDAIKLTDKIKNFDEILSVVLFGSVAREEATSNSDIDIVVIYSQKSLRSLKK